MGSKFEMSRRAFVAGGTMLMLSACGSNSVSKTSSSSATKSKVSEPGKYSGYNEAVFDEYGYERHSQYVTMSDGVKIAVDYYLPLDGGKPVTDALPVIFQLTPYNRISYEGQNQSKYCKDGLEPVRGGDTDQMDLLRYGYIVALADSRGTGASFGMRITTNSRDEARDGAEVIEWLASQSFCNGKVGTIGSSYCGQTQLEMISMEPKHLVASVVGITDYNKYDGWFRGGIPRAFGSNPDTVWGNTQSEIDATIQKLVKATVPVDEDADKTMLTVAVTGQRGSLSQIALFKSKIWRDSFCEETNSQLWNEVSASTYKKNINDSGVAIYNLDGAYDVFRREVFTMQANLTTPKKMTFGSWYHTEKKKDILWGIEMRRWFDFWIKGIDNGVMSEDPMTIKVSNYNFETDDYQGDGTGHVITKTSWPINSGKRTTLYLSDAKSASGSGLDDGVLSGDEPQEATILYNVKYGVKTSVESHFTTDESGMGVDQIAKVFTGSPLTEDCEIIGHPMANVSLSLENPGWMKENYDLDVFTFLSDYDPETDKAFLVTTGQIRASLRAVSNNCPYDFIGLPWHEDNVGSNQYLQLGQTYDLEMDMMPTAYTVKAGHCLRVTVSAACDRMYYLGRDQYEADPNIATPKVNLYLGKGHKTSVTLPNIYK